MKKFLIFYIIVMNSLGFILVSQDKRIASSTQYGTPENKQNRIAEADFTTFSAFGGAIGTRLGFAIRNHKTSSEKTYLRRDLNWLIIQNIIIYGLINNYISIRRKNRNNYSNLR